MEETLIWYVKINKIINENLWVNIFNLKTGDMHIKKENASTSTKKINQHLFMPLEVCFYD